jgi:hypothetical protein
MSYTQGKYHIFNGFKKAYSPGYQYKNQNILENCYIYNIQYAGGAKDR